VTLNSTKKCTQFATRQNRRELAERRGYLNAKRENTTIDVATMAKSVTKLELYRLKHHDQLLMDEAKSEFGSN